MAAYIGALPERQAIRPSRRHRSGQQKWPRCHPDEPFL